MKNEGKLGENHYVNPWSRPLFITVTWLLVMAGGIFVLTITLTQWDNQIADYFLLIFYSFALFLFLHRGYGMIVDSFEIIVEEDRMRGIGLYGQKKELLYDDIGRLVLPRYTAGTVDIYSKSKPRYRIRIDATLLHFGEMMEKILERLNYCEELEIDRLIESKRCWQKEPDHGIINRAKQRALEVSKRSN